MHNIFNIGDSVVDINPNADNVRGIVAGIESNLLFMHFHQHVLSEAWTDEPCLVYIIFIPEGARQESLELALANGMTKEEWEALPKSQFLAVKESNLRFQHVEIEDLAKFETEGEVNAPSEEN